MTLRDKGGDGRPRRGGGGGGWGIKRRRRATPCSAVQRRALPGHDSRRRLENTHLIDNRLPPLATGPSPFLMSSMTSPDGVVR